MLSAATAPPADSPRPAGEGETYSHLRWLTAVILLLAVFCHSLLWSAPSPLLTVIVADLSINLSAGGLLVSVICLMVTVVGLSFDRLRQVISARELFTWGLLLMAAGQLLLLLANSFGLALLFRILAGLGMGICMPVYAVLVMANFPERERPLLNTVYAALPYAASVLCFTVTVPLYRLCDGSWRGTLALFGVVMLVLALVWWAWRRHIQTPERPRAGETTGQKGLLRQVMKNKQVRLLMVADVCDLWGYNFLCAFLPAYFTDECGMAMAAASRLTAVFSLTGLGAGLICGLWMSRVGLRKPFTWPMHLLICAGTLLIAFGSGPWRVVGLVMAGFGNAGWAPALYTIPMEFKGMTPTKTGVAYSFIFSIGYLGAFVSPLLGGFIGDHFSLRFALALFSSVALLAAFVTFRMDETGPGRPVAARRQIKG